MSREDQITRITATLEGLTAGQLMWIERTAGLFTSPIEFSATPVAPFTSEVLQDFGDTLRIHHAFSAEAFSKDKFEYAMEQLLRMRGIAAGLAPKGNPGHDLTIGAERVSLKTQADRNIKAGEIWISKFMELGGGSWGADPTDLDGLRQQFLRHLSGYDRIFTLRTLCREPVWFYELVEIPKALFLACSGGTLEMMTASKQMPKPGYCRVSDGRGLLYSMYFDGGGERKLQIKGLRKDACAVIASWSFSVPEVV